MTTTVNDLIENIKSDVYSDGGILWDWETDNPLKRGGLKKILTKHLSPLEAKIEEMKFKWNNGKDYYKPENDYMHDEFVQDLSNLQDFISDKKE